MIWESAPWKVGLLSDAEKLLTLSVMEEEAAVDFEKTVLVSAFAIRKLIEAKKLTDRVAALDLRCHRLPLIDSANVPDLGNWHQLDRFYDSSKAKPGTIKLKEFANQLIHSYILGPIIGNEQGKLIGFFVTSDSGRLRHLLEFSIDDVAAALRRVGNDDVVYSRQTRDANGQWVVNNYGASDPETKAQAVID